jgi:uncharacterized membrane protein YdcZ (DUF606 family)
VDKRYLDESLGVRISKGRVVTADSLIGGQIVWVKLLCGQFVGGRIVDAPGFFIFMQQAKNISRDAGIRAQKVP